MGEAELTFSFGENWQSFLEKASSDALAQARHDIESWLGRDAVRGKTVLDIGSGSGIHSLAFHDLGAKKLIALDVEEKSVEATRQMWRTAGEPENWEVLHGSALDKVFLQSLNDGQKFDIVYSWGVLHHTGNMWQALENTCELVRNGGILWLAIYAKGPEYENILTLKRNYNQASPRMKRIIEGRYIFNTYIYPDLRKFLLDVMHLRLSRLNNRFAWRKDQGRGMDTYHNVVDWLGGLPYEEVGVGELVRFTRPRGFVLENVYAAREGGNHILGLARYDQLPPSPLPNVT